MRRKFRGTLTTVDWGALCANHAVERCAHFWVTDESIAESLEHLHFDDPAVPHHRRTHRANRIASIVLMMEGGVQFDPLRVRVTRDGIALLDGHHRLRAYQFRRRLEEIPVLVCPQKRSRRSSVRARKITSDRQELVPVVQSGAALKQTAPET